MFFKLIAKHFPRSHRLPKILNTNTIKLSYSATTNMEILIKQYNKIVLHKNKNLNTGLCNFRNKESCPLNGKCLEACIGYKEKVSTDGKCVIYYRTTDNDFKSRCNNHTTFFWHKSHTNNTELLQQFSHLRNVNSRFDLN